MKQFHLFVCLVFLSLVMTGIPAAASPTITTISPAVGYADGKTITVTINGTNFEGTTIDEGNVWLEMSGEDDISVYSISSWTNTSIVCRFRIFTTTEPGDWDLVVLNMDGVSAKKSGAFTITAPSPTPTPTHTPELEYGSFDITSISVDPTGSLPSGTLVNVTYTVDFSQAGVETFPSSNELQMSTDLNSPTWSYSLVLDGVDTPQPLNTGQMISLSGWVLSYPSSVEESLRVTLTGTIPSQSCPILVKIQEFDAHNHGFIPFYQLGGEGCDFGLVSRTLPPAVSPGSQFTVSLNPHPSLPSDPGWKVSESVPFGFNLVSSTAFHTIQSGPNYYLFIQNSNTPFSYVVRAPLSEGPYSFRGSFTDAFKGSGTVSGDTTVNVGTSYQNYRNATTGKIEQVDARRAMTDNMNGIISNQGAGSVLENYFLGL